jgi:hypothetical protein
MIEEYAISDGVAREGDIIFWHASGGLVEVNRHNWHTHRLNISNFPHLYSFKGLRSNTTQLITWHLVIDEGLPHTNIHKCSEVFTVLLHDVRHRGGYSGSPTVVLPATLNFFGGDVSRPYWGDPKTSAPIETSSSSVTAWAESVKTPDFGLRKLQKNNKT